MATPLNAEPPATTLTAPDQGEAAVFASMRAAGVSAQMHAGSGEGMGSMKSQFKKADASGAAFGLIFGTDELARGEVTVKSLRDGQGAQRCECLEAVAQWAASLQSF